MKFNLSICFRETMERLWVFFLFLYFSVPLCNSTLHLKEIEEFFFCDSVDMNSHSYFGLVRGLLPII